MLLLEHTAVVSRSSALGTNGRMGPRETVSSIDCLALPLDTRTTVQAGLTIGKAWEVYFDTSCDVAVGDLLTVNGTELSVTGVQTYTTAMNAHKRALCTQEKP